MRALQKVILLHVLDNQKILELPLNRRNALDLVNLAPGAFRRSGEVSIAEGRRRRFGRYLLVKPDDNPSVRRTGLGPRALTLFLA